MAKDRRSSRDVCYGSPKRILSGEADLCPLLSIPGFGDNLWLGLVVSQHDGSTLAQAILEDAPTVNDLANLLANAMQRPLTDEICCRPSAIRLRDNPEWEELLPHLEQLDIRAVVTEDLEMWDDTAGGLVDYLKSGVWRERTNAVSGNVEDQDEFRNEMLNLRLATILYPVKRKDRNRS